ncbi:MAG: hypothetical protein KA138_05395 [Saprospiraceae bacterium]|nr:hypothetical protein [Saprospiraceae bacterium]
MYSDNIKQLMAQAFEIGSLAYQTGPVKCWLKQIRVDQLDKRSRLILAECFPDFDGQFAVSEFYQSSGYEFEYSKYRTLRTKTGRLRRYAGDETLPGGRYHSICQDASGNDGGTLVWELMSYWGNQSRMFPELIDSTVHVSLANKLRETIPNLDRPFLMLKYREISEISDQGIILGDSTAIVLPLTIQEVVLDSVVDLRLPVVQDFFSNVLGRLEAALGMTGNFSDGKVVTQTLKEAPADFRELLPTLLSPQPGGSTFLDAIGAICRNSGVKGLVFPSSRLDSNIEYVRSEGIKTFSGWNFVDYRDSPYVAPKVLLELLGLQVQWLQPYEVGIQIEWEEDSERRAWKVIGAEKGERQRYGLEWQIMAGQKRLSPSWNPWFAARQQNT